MSSADSSTITGMQLSLLHCHVCKKLLASNNNQPNTKCSRCGGTIHLRLPDSLNRTWAFLMASVILYIPANTLPIMAVHKLGEGDAHTIVGGIIALIHGGMYPIAFVVFVASLLVPFLKMLGIAAILISVQRRSRGNPRHKTSIFRIIEFVGRWSMLDVFMVSILVAMVDLGGVATVYAGAGATAFAAVVVFTMLAALSFDPRLIWDNSKDTSREKT